MLLDNLKFLNICLLDQEQQKIMLMDSFNSHPAEEKVLLMDSFMSCPALGLDEKSSDADGSSYPEKNVSQ